MWWWRYFGRLVVIGLTVPGLIWVLISERPFGPSELARYFVITISLMMVITVCEAVKSMDRDLIRY